MANQKNAEIFDCNICDFSCSKKSNYFTHLSTRKHTRLMSLVGKNAENAEITGNIHVCDVCNKTYKHPSSLSKHRKICIDNVSPHKLENILMDVLNENKKLQSVVLQQKDQIDILIPQMTKTENKTENNTHINKQVNNQFNFQIFLDTECKDAMNLKDFVDSLKIKMDDLSVLKDKGLAESIAGVLVNGLKELAVTQRPIHCSDLSENKLYIKNKDVWREDKDRANMSYTINSVANKNRKAIKEWEAANPTYMEDDVLMREYLKMVQAVMKPLCENEDNNTIIQKVSEINDKGDMIM